MTRKFFETLEDEGDGSLEKGWYDVEVIDARPIDTNDKMVFADLKVLAGPDKDRVTTVSLYLPDDSERGAQFYFKAKVRGFARQMKGVYAQNVDDGDFAAAVAEAIIGAQFSAELGQQSEGAYAGRQELLSSQPLAAGPAAAAAPAPAPEPAAEPAAAAPAPAVEEEEVPF